MVAASAAAALLTCGLSTPAIGAELNGRARWNYNDARRHDAASRFLYQEYGAQCDDQVFGAVDLRFDLRWDRIVDYQVRRAVDRPTLVVGLRGDAFDFMLRWMPRQYTSPAGSLTGARQQGLQAIWRYQHDGLPGLRLEYHEDQRDQNPFNFTTFSSAARMRAAELDHRVGDLRFGAGYRATSESSSSVGAARRETATADLRVAFDRAVVRRVRVSLGADAMRSETGQGIAPRAGGRTHDLRGSAVWTPATPLQVGVSGYFRESIGEGSGQARATDVSRTLSLKAAYKPGSSLDLSAQRDIRDSERPDYGSYSDIVRIQAIYTGLLRSRVRTRVTAAKQMVVRTRNATAPADAADISVQLPLYRRAEGRASVTYSRQSDLAVAPAGRHAMTSLLEVNSRLSRKLYLRFDCRSSAVSTRARLFENDSQNYSAHINYSGATGFSLSGSARRSLFEAGPVRTQDSYSFNLSGRLATRLSWNLDATLADVVSAGQPGRTSSYSARLQYNFGPGAFLTASYRTAGVDGSLDDDAVAAAMQVVF